LEQLAHIVTQPQDGRLTRTLVNRLWQRLMGRGLVEPVDDMEKPAWNPSLLDWLAEDFAAHKYNVRFLIQRITTSRAYQLPAVDLGEPNSQEFVFHGPAIRRLSAEQFRDALTSLTGVGYGSPAAEITPSESERKKFGLPIPINWIWNDSHAADKARPGHVYFRKTFQLAGVPPDATAVVACDNSFTFYVNGRQVGTGNEFKNAYVFDLRPWLKPGQNLFAVDAVNNLPDNSAPTDSKPPPGADNPAGLLFYARLRPLEKGVQKTNDFSADATWFCSTQKQANWQMPEFAANDWIHAFKLGESGMLPWRVTKIYITTKLAAAYPGKVRASLVASDPLMTALGRPNRDQVVTTRPTAATTLQALEMTNGETLADILKRAADNLLADPAAAKGKLVATLYEKALARKPTESELKSARELVGQPAQPAGVQDLLWTVTMLPEFQLIY
jgi:hypothetical protein